MRCLLTIVLFTSLLGCTADTNAPPVTDAGATETSPSTVAAADTIAPAAETSAQTSDPVTASQSADAEAVTRTIATSTENTATEDSTTATDTDTEASSSTKELKTAEDYFQALKAKLDGVVPTPELIAEAVALGEEGVAKLPGNVEMAGLYGGLLYQTIPFEKDAARIRQYRLRMGELAHAISGSKDYVPSAIAMFIEEAKGHLSNPVDVKKSLASILEARKLGFDEVRLLFIDPDLEKLVKSKEIRKELEGLVDAVVEERLKAEKPFDFRFALTTFDGKKISSEDYKGKPLIVDFWGTWCAPCREVIPHLTKIAEKYKDSINVLGVNFEDPREETPYLEAKARFEKFIKDQPLNYTCAHGTYRFGETIPGWRGGFPTMFFIDSQGKAVWMGEGYHSYEEIEATIKILLKQAKDKKPKA